MTELRPAREHKAPSRGIIAALLAMAAVAPGVARAEDAELGLPPVVAQVPVPAAPAEAPPAPPAEAPPPSAQQPAVAPPAPAPPPPPPASPPPTYGAPPAYGSPAYAAPTYPPPAYRPPPPRYYAPPRSYAPPPYYAPPRFYYPSGYTSPTAMPPPGIAAQPTGNVHDGFYLRFHFGGGYMDIAGKDSAGTRTTISGGSASFGAAVGGALAEDLILFADFFASVADSPNVNRLGVDTRSRGSAGLGGFGAGLIYYVMPVNMYLSGELAVMSFSMSDVQGTTTYSSDAGLGFHGLIGKEWWVSSEWGLGVAGELIVASMNDKNDHGLIWTGSAFSLLFSSTFN